MTSPRDHSIRIRGGGIILEGILGLPASPSDLAIFAHGSDSGRLSPRNNFVASTGSGTALQAAAREPVHVKAIVSRGGRPDLAEP
ncbi:MAG TPA: hypothetical protein PKD12_20205 [Nitrospira sp.]|nr:hypothetical protein [Nitrospira sp.]